MTPYNCVIALISGIGSQGIAHYQRIELPLRQSELCRSAARAARRSGVEPSGSTPHADAAVHEQLQAGGPRVREDVAVIRESTAQSARDMRYQSLRAGAHDAHVQRLRAQPQGIDPNHRSSSRSHLAQSAAAEIGQVMLAAIEPRLSSNWIDSPKPVAAGDGDGARRRRRKRQATKSGAGSGDWPHGRG
ncbi:hypothetical protein QTH90_27205 [Variovorax sp. J2P1-59]|nr:hypothetical protein [Variovorax sp. J2P1-59]MDM0078125.1 hypothetical protein [Variovorax sp. J2P1-59]